MARRELKITYGSYVAGAGQTKRHLTGPFAVLDGPDRFEVRYEVLLAGTSGASDMETEVAAARAAFALPNQDFVVELVDPDNTSTVQGRLIDARVTSPNRKALNIVPEISEPLEHEGRSGRGTRFEVVIRGERTASYDNDFLRQDFSYRVAYSPSRRRTLEVSGTYTATASVFARANYEAEIETKAAAIQTALGGTWTTVPGGGETVTIDKNDHTARFSRTYREIFYRESVGSLDDADVADQVLTISVLQPGNVGERSETRLRRIVADYEAWIDGESSTNLDALWTSKLRPWVLQNIKDAAGTATVGVVSDDYRPDRPNNVIRARLELVAATQKLIGRLVETTDDIDFGRFVRNYWPDANTADDEEPTAGQTYRRGKVVLRTVTTTTTVAADVAPPRLGKSAGGGGGGAAGIFGIGAQLKLDFGGGMGIFGLGEGFSLEFTGPGGGAGGARGGGQAVPSAGISGGGVLLRRTRRNVRRWEGTLTEGFPVTDQVVTEVFRISGAPPARATGSGGGFASQARADSGIRAKQGNR